MSLCLIVSMFLSTVPAVAKTYSIPLFVRWKSNTLDFRICTDPEAAIGENYPLSEKVYKTKVTASSKFIYLRWDRSVSGHPKTVPERMSKNECRKGLIGHKYMIQKMTIKNKKLKRIEVIDAAD